MRVNRAIGRVQNGAGWQAAAGSKRNQDDDSGRGGSKAGRWTKLDMYTFGLASPSVGQDSPLLHAADCAADIAVDTNRQSQATITIPI